MSQVNFPFGAAEVLIGTNAAINAVTIENEGLVFIKIPQLSQNTTLNLTLAAPMRVGSLLLVQWLSDGTARSLTPGTGFRAVGAIAGVINKNKSALFVWDGSAFLHVSTGLDF